MGYSNGVFQSQRSKRERKIVYVSRSNPENQHGAGINRLALDEDCAHLFTASRDSTIKRWSLREPQPTFSFGFEGHADWVNDLALVNDTLLSCSSDTTIKAWRAGTGECVRTWSLHTDYVQALAAAPAANKFASAGLSSELFVWDLERATGPHVQSRFKESGMHTYAPSAANGHKESVYSVAMNSTATLLVSGGPENGIRVWDPRSALQVAKLKGHTEVVKALVLDASARLCLSGASDNTFKLWDLGQQRCVETFTVHKDSVWAVAVNSSFTRVFSGGRDSKCYMTDLHSRRSVLLFTEEHPIRSLALHTEPQATSGGACVTMWAATDRSTVNQWVADVDAETEDEGADAASGAERRAHSSQRSSDQVCAPSRVAAVIFGSPSIVRHAVLSNRLHVLIKFCTGELALWDITRGEVAARYGEASFEAKEKELSEVVSMASWFAVDTRLGCVAVTLEPASCFSAEMYALDLNVAGATDELKVNLGEQTLRMLFSQWLERRSALGLACSPTAETSAPPSRAASTTPMPSQEEDESLLVEPVFALPSPVPAIVSETADGEVWRKLPTQLTGHENESLIPPWVIDAVVNRRLGIQKDNHKVSFFLLPFTGTHALAQSKLSAPKILRIQKVMAYVAQRLDLDMTLTNQENLPHLVDVMCNKTILPPHMSLATVRQYIW
eukprot:CAMPEP_0114236432 /NCGR_PEP_ID=MMETSP0058-20121206/6839_1 /TAXON_ID=36894 /ORGANISM="Pyramimonas parkeae, CCMP726" /LENGTH=671 /DNA_ID=CAMNT_0001348377 /DNA_START=226 /DNA_END=2238 /DNA_ORIENTATION=+